MRHVGALDRRVSKSSTHRHRSGAGEVGMARPQPWRSAMTTRFTLLLGFALLLAPLTARSDADRDEHKHRIRHVLLLSIDGFHGVDLQNWVNDHANSTLARPARRGVTFDDARTSTPSDSFPGLVSIVTGGTPRV